MDPVRHEQNHWQCPQWRSLPLRFRISRRTSIRVALGERFYGGCIRCLACICEGAYEVLDRVAIHISQFQWIEAFDVGFGSEFDE